MSGKRHHFIPQFLLRGFATEAGRNKHFVWAHFKGREPFRSNVINIGVEGHFYSDEESSEVDDCITEAERAYADTVKSLLASPEGDIIDSRIPELLSHFEIRTRHLRESFSQIGDQVAASIIELLGDPEALKAVLLKQLEEDPSLIQKELEEFCHQNGVPLSQIGLMMEAIKPMLPGFVERQIVLFHAAGPELEKTFSPKMREGARSGHLKALKESVSPEVRAARYSNLLYRVESPQVTSAILGDSILLFHLAGEREFAPFIDKDDQLRAVIIPLSPRRILVGAVEADYCVPLHFAEGIAACSREFFVAQDRSESTESLQASIGVNAALLPEAEVQKMLKKTLWGG